MFNYFSSKKKSSEQLTLPPLGKKGKVAGKVATSLEDDTFGLEGDVADNESTDSFTENAAANEEDDGYDYRKPDGFDTWIRAADDDKAIYFYNVKSGESAWLGPCGTCCKPSNKYCIDCGNAYCDRDFKKRHEKKSRHKHHWQIADPANIPKVQPDETLCIECSLKIASLMCTDCWDAYCPDCFNIVHRIGALKHHPTIPYKEAQKGWIRHRGESIKDPDTYTHGTSGVTTYEKPYELMNALERKLHRQFKRCETAAADVVNEIAGLQFEIEQAKFQRDRTWEESQSALHEMHSKHVEKSKPKEGNLLDHSKLKGGRGLFSKIFGVSTQDELYCDKILNPSDRRRGEARTTYIRGVLETAAGIKTEDDEES